MDQLLAQLPGDPVMNAAAIGAVALALLDFLLGTVRAIASSQWRPEYAATWVRLQLLGQVLPIVLVLTFSQVIGDVSIGEFSFNVLAAAGLAAAATYAVTTGQSVADSLRPSVPDAPPEPAT